MMSEERGPTWYDVSIYAEHIRDVYGRLVYFKLAPPVRRLDGRGYTSWCGLVELHGSVSGSGVERVFQASWGSGGAARTAPAALYAALTLCEGYLEEKARKALAQATF